MEEFGWHYMYIFGYVEYHLRNHLKSFQPFFYYTGYISRLQTALLSVVIAVSHMS